MDHFLKNYLLPAVWKAALQHCIHKLWNAYSRMILEFLWTPSHILKWDKNWSKKNSDLPTKFNVDFQVYLYITHMEQIVIKMIYKFHLQVCCSHLKGSFTHDKILNLWRLVLINLQPSGLQIFWILAYIHQVKTSLYRSDIIIAVST